jgi:hypothetical protein
MDINGFWKSLSQNSWRYADHTINYLISYGSFGHGQVPKHSWRQSPHPMSIKPSFFCGSPLLRIVGLGFLDRKQLLLAKQWSFMPYATLRPF